MTKTVPLAAFLLLMSLSCDYALALPNGEQTLCEKAETALSRVETGQKPRWSVQMYEIFEGSRDCLQGQLDDAYKTKLARFMIEDPEGIPALMRLMHDDRSFQEAVLGRISGDISNNDLKRIAKNADTYCPPKAFKSCQALSAKARSALQDQGSLTEQPEALTPAPRPVESFSSFWSRFQKAALAGDYEALAELTRFPFLDKKVVPDSHPIPYSKASFVRMGDRLLSSDSGNGLSTMRQLIESKLPADFAYMDSQDHVQVGVFEFEKTPTGWQWTATHLSSE